MYFGLKFLYLSLRNKSFYSTSVSAEAKANALTLSKKTRVIPNFIVMNKNISYIPNNNYLFIGRNESRKNLKLFEDLSKSINTTNSFIAITNKKSGYDSINYLIDISNHLLYKSYYKNIYRLRFHKSRVYYIQQKDYPLN